MSNLWDSVRFTRFNRFEDASWLALTSRPDQLITLCPIHYNARSVGNSCISIPVFVRVSGIKRGRIKVIERVAMLRV